ncbi:DoxX family protein [Variovorax sp. J22P168]|uniref:DoxX family protein n=1 Tax=Variovorax jilinensis TaxID=3053513 RepID=UPI0025762495|nr:DoxX family protein [Variovorax sp. J22P168]MDM0013222.1 DoxX family protein [Variovorax sp. J22P168]
MIRSDDTGKLVLRLALGILLLLHGAAKLTTGVGFVSGLLSSHGLPGVLAYLVYVGEILAPVLLIGGIYTRAAAWIIVINMLVAIWLVHTGQLWSLDKNGGWALETQGLFLFSALAVAFLGAGRFSVAGSGGRLN